MADDTPQEGGPVYTAPLLEPEPDPDVTTQREAGGDGG